MVKYRNKQYYRIDFYLGGYDMRKSLRKLIASVATCSLALALAAGIMPNVAEAVDCSKAGKKAAKAELNLDTPEYHAYFGFQQTGSWTYRDAWYNPASGLDGTSLSTGDYNTLFTDGGNATVDGVTITDAVIKGNGTYSVSVTGLNGAIPADDGADIKTSLIYVSTDIPSSAIGTLSFTDVKLIVDGAEIALPSPEPYVNADAQELGLYQFDLVNTYHPEAYTSPSILAMNDSVEIQFTVSGFNADDPDAVVAEPTEEPTQEPATSDTSSGTSGTDSSTDNNKEDSGSSATTIVIVVVVIVVTAGAAFFLMKKKK